MMTLNFAYVIINILEIYETNTVLSHILEIVES